MEGVARPVEYSRDAHILQVVDLIEHTQQLQLQHTEYVRRYIAPNPRPSPSLLHPYILGLMTKEELQLSQGYINESLRQLGGIPHFYIDTASGQRRDCTLEEWRGFDPDKSGKHLWKVKGMSDHMLVSLTPDHLEEIRAQFSPNE